MGIIRRLREASPQFRAGFDCVEQVFGFDKRSLAVFRIVFGICIIGDLVNRMFEIRAHYTDWGIMSRAEILTNYHGQEYIMAHMMNGTFYFQLGLFLVHIAITVAFVLGYRTGLSAFLTWFLLTSVQMHSPYVGHAGDVYARLVLFYAMFLPLGEKWSLDAAFKNWDRNPVPVVAQKSASSAEDQTDSSPALTARDSNLVFVRQRRRSLSDRSMDGDESNHGHSAGKRGVGLSPLHLSMAGMGLMMHMVLVYVTSFYHKTGPEWKETGDAVFYSLSLAYFQLPVARLLLMLPHEILRLMAFATLAWEHFGVLFLFSPWRPQEVRLFGVLAFWAMHSAFGFGLRIAEFYFFPMATFLAFLPPLVWDRFVIPRARTQSRTSLRVSADPTSKFGRTLAFLLREVLLAEGAEVKFKALPANMILSVENSKGAELRGREAFLYCLKSSPAFFLLGYALALATKLPGLGPLTETAFVALHQISIDDLVPPVRKLVHLPRRIRNPSQDKFEFLLLTVKVARKLFLQIFLLYCIVLCVSWNFQNFEISPLSVPHNQRWVVWFLRLDQMWSMFSPGPPHNSFYFVMPAELVNETKVELFRNGALWRWEPNEAISYDPPEDFYVDFQSHRWYKYFENGISQKNDWIRLGFGRWICREFNSRYEGGAQLYKYTIYYLTRENNLDGTHTVSSPYSIWDHVCFDSRPDWNGTLAAANATNITYETLGEYVKDSQEKVNLENSHNEGIVNHHRTTDSE